MIGPLILLLALHPIAVVVTPRVCAAPCDLRITVTIEPNPANRWYAVALMDGDLVLDSSVQELDADSPRTQPFLWFKDIPPGDYQHTAVLYQEREVGRAQQTVLVN